MNEQQYEDYWKITLAYTDIFSDDFNQSLRKIIDFIDDNKGSAYSTQKYDKLQALLERDLKLNDASIRKIINTYVKLGFVNTYLESYHPDARAFVNETAQDIKKTLYSKIVYSNSSFSRSVTTESDNKELNFLVKTLEQLHSLNRADILALMTVDPQRYPKGYLTLEELDEAKKYTEKIQFVARKYNQISHLWSVLGNLDGLVPHDGVLYLEKDAPEFEELKRAGRDQYLQRLFKNQLIEESVGLYGKPICVVEKLSYPVLIASHIKPFIQSTEDEAFDVNNGLLLSRNMDALFDLGYISFQNNGKINLSDRLGSELKDVLMKYKLGSEIINESRAKYLDYHRDRVFS